MSLSIIIPIAPNDHAEDLIKQIQRLGFDPIAITQGNRGKSLNRGAKLAKGKYLLFLHADSKLDDVSIKKLPEILMAKKMAQI